MTGGIALPHTEHPHRDWPYRRSTAMRYGIAMLVVLGAIAFRLVAYSDLQSNLMFSIFVPAAMVAAWYGGVGPGLLATMLGLAIGAYFFLPPREALWPLAQREIIAVGAYAVTTTVCVILCENLHQVIRWLEHAFEHERHHSEQRAAALDTAVQPAIILQHGSPFRRPLLARYGATVGLVILAFALRYWLFGTQDHRVPFLFFVPAAMIATWYGGMIPGLLATVAGLMLGDYFFLSEHHAMGPVRESERLATGLYAVTTTLCVMLFENLHNHIRRLEHAVDHARHQHAKPHPDTHAGSASSH